MENEIEFSEGQNNRIYIEYLRPLKLKISQILLYDTKAAAEFLNKYNDLIENAKENELLNRITELEFEIGEYEQGAGKRKIFENKSETLITEIRKMIEDSEQLELDEFEERVKALEENYKENFSRYSFKEKDDIDEKIYELRAKLILKKVQQSDLDTIEINPEDEVGLMMYLNKEINRLQLNEKAQVKDCVQRLKYNLMRGIDAVHNIETWKMLRDAQNGEKTREEIVPKSNELMVVDKSKNNKGIISKIFGRFFKKTPENLQDLTLTDSNFVEIVTIEWLSEHVPQNMLEDWEKELEKEKNIQGSIKKYLPDGKAFVCDCFRKIGEKKEYSTRIDDDGIEKTLILEEGKVNYAKYNGIEYGNVGGSTNIKVISSGIEICKDMVIFADWGNDIGYNSYIADQTRQANAEYNIKLIRYAEMLDSILGTNYTNRMLNMYEKAIITQDPKELGDSKLFYNMDESFRKLERDYTERGFNILAKDAAERIAFYKRNSFKEEIKVDWENGEETKIKNETHDKQEEIRKNNNGSRE